MIFAGHAAVGTIIGASVITFASNEADRPTLLVAIFILAVISHYLTDFVPHGHYYFNISEPTRKMFGLLALDVLVGLFLLVPLLTQSPTVCGVQAVLTGLAGALAPDFLSVLARKFGLINRGIFAKENWLHEKWAHWHSNGKLVTKNGSRAGSWTDIWQVVVWISAYLIMIMGDF